ncbi:SNAP receptor activity protein [Polyrhizophydium stewartii]|uniref:SNAP receptor activity protein n=1 Tax=Polyrhizophydium stewartii TaxID=2732419 RepID=A0ABR4NGK0_9FUNG|nr:Protein transport protein S9 plasma membrane t-SNARE [Polyrhizophydium stewartii]
MSYRGGYSQRSQSPSQQQPYRPPPRTHSPQGGPPPAGPGYAPQPAAGASRWAAAAASAQHSYQDPRAGGSGRTWRDDEEDWDSGEWLEHKTKQVQGESLSSTRRALQRLNETQATAESSVARLNQQSEQLHSIEQRLDRADSLAKVNDAKIDHLKSVNRFFMLPSFGKAKAKRREEELKKQAEGQGQSKAVREREDEWQARTRRQEEFRAQYDASPRGPPPRGDSASGAAGPSRYDRMYTTPQGLDRDATEEEIDSNLDEISGGLARLKMMGLGMNAELDSQTSQLRRIDERTESSRAHVDRLNRKMEHFAPRPRGK